MPVPEPLRPPDTSIEPGRPVERFAARAAGMTASEIRALFAVASRPEVAGPQVGTTGYCMGGALSLAAAGNFPERVVAAVCGLNSHAIM